ncbi:MAG: AmmeMemoRadiSam system protein A [Chloroflexi bacterium]|nr:AmmeMemoRadiSam system protein A [Chloroflexota bacterium]
MSGVVFGCIVPHPPLLVPDIGRGQDKAISSTIHALESLAKMLADARPETVVIISPHGHSLPDAMGVATCTEIKGDLRSWGARSADLDTSNDLVFVDALMKEAEAASIPLRSIGDRSYNLDHGVLVPMYFLVKGAKGLPLVPLTFSWLSLEEHYAFGRAIARAAARSGRKVAIIASGDLSHRLIPEAPAGYDPQGEVFDKSLVEAVKVWDIRSILDLDPELIERAGECGLRSICILLGVLSESKVAPEVLSYEGPFGVGYLVAACHVQGAAAQGRRKMHPVARLAKDTVECFIVEGKLPKLKATCKEMKERAGVFVSLKKHGQLRGCIGTFEPTQPDVAREVMANAVSSSTQDPRFPAVTAEELPYLEYSVDVLTKPEPVADRKKLDPRKYGVIVEARGRKGLLLPDLEGVDTVEQQVSICCMKAGLRPDEPVKLSCFQVRRYK